LVAMVDRFPTPSTIETLYLKIVLPIYDPKINTTVLTDEVKENLISKILCTYTATSLMLVILKDGFIIDDSNHQSKREVAESKDEETLMGERVERFKVSS
jgi:hypothetical protein